MTVKLIAIQIIHKSIAYFVDKCLNNLPAMWETQVRSLGWEDPLRRGMTTHFSILVLENSLDRGALGLVDYSPWVAKSWTQPSN